MVSKGIRTLNVLNSRRVVIEVAVLLVATCGVVGATENPYAKNPLAVAVKRGMCQTTTKLINTNIDSNDRENAFLTGRLLDEGICVKADPSAAAHFYARAAELGDRNGMLDFAMEVGLGVGVEQDYQRAGDLCRAAGVDRQSKLSTYALGYACTVRGVAGKLLRQKLPNAAFSPALGAAALVEFTPSTRQMRVLATPRVTRVESLTGSNLTHPVVDAKSEIEKAWPNALAAAPQPDTTRLDDKTVELPVDLDLTLEAPRVPEGSRDLGHPLFRDDLHGTDMPH